MKIKIIHTQNNSRKNQIKRAIEILNSVQRYFYFSLNDTLSDVSDTYFVNWQTFCGIHQSTHIDEYLIYITEKPFDDNWFSHESPCYAVISMFGWEKFFAPPSLKAYLIYQIIQAVICFEADFTEDVELSMVHSDAVGCMFDFCENKNDIKLGMTAGIICPNCRATLKRYGVHEEAITSTERVLDYVRKETIGYPVVLAPNRAFVVMRFSVHDENDNAYKYGIQSALEELGIECRRGDNDIITAHILEKVRIDIQQSRYIIAKVDSDNLNVYFELGLAMGLNKDILLISEKRLTANLPADLRGWNCMTYQEGDYGALRNSIINYFKRHYNY